MLLITFRASAYRILNTEQGLGLGLSIVLEERNIFPIEESLLNFGSSINCSLGREAEFL